MKVITLNLVSTPARTYYTSTITLPVEAVAYFLPFEAEDLVKRLHAAHKERAFIAEVIGNINSLPDLSQTIWVKDHRISQLEDVIRRMLSGGAQAKHDARVLVGLEERVYACSAGRHDWMREIGTEICKCRRCGVEIRK